MSLSTDLVLIHSPVPKELEASSTHTVVSLNRGTPVMAPKCYSPHDGTSKNLPIIFFGNRPYQKKTPTAAEGTRKTNTETAGSVDCHFISLKSQRF